MEQKERYAIYKIGHVDEDGETTDEQLIEAHNTKIECARSLEKMDGNYEYFMVKQYMDIFQGILLGWVDYEDQEPMYETQLKNMTQEIQWNCGYR